MASTPASFCKIFSPFPWAKPQRYPTVRSQKFRDEGNSANIVDANLSILRSRTEKLRVKERLNTCYRLDMGWNYKAGYDNTHKKRVLLVESFELAAVVGSSLSLVFLTGSIFIFLYSLIVHIHNPM